MYEQCVLIEGLHGIISVFPMESSVPTREVTLYCQYVPDREVPLYYQCVTNREVPEV